MELINNLKGVERILLRLSDILVGEMVGDGNDAGSIAVHICLQPRQRCLGEKTWYIIQEKKRGSTIERYSTARAPH